MTIENGMDVSGTGSVLGDSPILQDKGYFEVTIKAEGTFAVGVATKDTALTGVLSQEKVATAWTLTSSMQGLPALPVGSTLGVALDQGDFPVQVYFYLDGKVCAASWRRRVPRVHCACALTQQAHTCTCACACSGAGRQPHWRDAR